MGYLPAVPAAGVPLSVAVPFPLLTNVTPLGSAPVSVTDGVGVPVVVTVKLPAVPTVNVVLLALVIAGAWFTVRVKLWLAGVPTPLLAVIVIGYLPPVPAAGVPLSVAVPFPLLTNVTPLGSAPVSVSGRRRCPRRRYRETPCRAHRKRRVVGAGDRRGLRSVHRQREALVGRRTHAVAGCDCQGVIAPVPAAGVPLSVAVPFPLLTNVTPLGSAPVSVRDGVGVPVVVTVKLPAVAHRKRGAVGAGDRRSLVSPRG